MLKQTTTLSTLPIELILKIVRDADNPVTEDSLVKTCRTLKNAILLCHYGERNLFSPGLSNKNSYLFDLQSHQFPWMLSPEHILQRIHTLFGNEIGGTLQRLIQLKNVILAGGSVALALDERVSLKALAKSTTDLDFFIYGTYQKQVHTGVAIFELLANHDPKYYLRNNVIDVFIRGFPRMIQLVFNSEEHPYDVVSAFDLGYVQTFYDGTSVYASNLAVVALKEKVTVSTIPLLSRQRLEKTQKKGFAVLNIGNVQIDDQPNPYLVKTQFLLACIKRELESGNVHLPIFSILSTTSSLNVQSFITSLKPWPLRYGQVTGRAASFQSYANVLDKIEFRLTGRRLPNVTEYEAYIGREPMRFSTNVLQVANTEYEHQLVVHESPLNAFVKLLKQKCSDQFYFEELEKERRYEDEWLKLKRKRFTELVDAYMTAYEKPLQSGDRIVCEIRIKVYLYLPPFPVPRAAAMSLVVQRAIVVL